MSSIPFPKPPPRIDAVQAGRLLSSLEDDEDDPYQVVCTRIEDIKSGLQLLSMNKFRENFPGQNIELDDERSGPRSGPPTHWLFKISGYPRKRIRIGTEHRKFENNGPVAVINVNDKDHIGFFDKLNSYYQNNGNLNANF